MSQPLQLEPQALQALLPLAVLTPEESVLISLTYSVTGLRSAIRMLTYRISLASRGRRLTKAVHCRIPATGELDSTRHTSPYYWTSEHGESRRSPFSIEKVEGVGPSDPQSATCERASSTYSSSLLRVDSCSGCSACDDPMLYECDPAMAGL